jgi:hypothetical protein
MVLIIWLCLTKQGTLEDRDARLKTLQHQLEEERSRVRASASEVASATAQSQVRL